jgi:RimJ/RimL family protein N-acetyltransferase
LETAIIAANARDFEWLIDGDPPVKDGLRLPPGGVDERPVLEHVRSITAMLQSHGCAGSWMAVSNGEVVGLCGYKSAPSTEGVVEIGYNVAPSRRRLGHATRAIAALVASARLDPAVRMVTAKTAVDNVASQRVLQRNGFERVGSGPDPEDGAPVVFWRLHA